MARAMPRTRAMKTTSHTANFDLYREWAERQQLESELESAYKSKMAVYEVAFVLGMALGVAMLE
ncbi:unnamed protein product [Ectocarpus fasciculatus]